MIHTLRMNILKFLLKTLEKLVEPIGMQALCKEGQELYPSDVDWEKLSELATQSLTDKRFHGRMKSNKPGLQAFGLVHHEQYPFISRKHMTRTEEAIGVAQKVFKMVSSNCALRPRIFSQDFPSEVEHFGVYATADEKPTSPLFQDKTIFGASDVVSSVALTLGRSQVCESCCGSLPTDSERSKASCCSAVYCSEQCLTAALSFYHQAICGQNNDWLFEGIKETSINSQEINGPLWLRVLSTCVQGDCHPLDHPLITRLIPLYAAGGPRRWTLHHNIIRPNQIQQLGVGIFQDIRYDTWVLQQVGIRLITNHNCRRTQDGRILNAMNHLSSFFYHSCEPNSACHTAPAGYGANVYMEELRQWSWSLQSQLRRVRKYASTIAM